MTYRYCWRPTSKPRATLLALVFCFIAGVSLAACSSQQMEISSPPAPLYWQAQPGQLATSGSAGAFAVKWIQITSQQLQLYYIFLSTKLNQLQATASASHLSNSTAATSLATTVQVLGHISDYSIGVIHVAWANHVNQLIGLQLTALSPTGVHVSTWQLTPLKQLYVDPQTGLGFMALNTATSGLPEADWMSVVEGAQEVSYVKIIIAGQLVADRSYVFVRSDNPATVTTTSKAEYLGIAGSANFTP